MTRVRRPDQAERERRPSDGVSRRSLPRRDPQGTHASAREEGGRRPRRGVRGTRGARAGTSLRPCSARAASRPVLRQTSEQRRRDCGRARARARVPPRATRPATGGERARQPVVDQVQLRLRDASARGKPLDGRMEPGRSSDRELPCADESERDTVRVPIQGTGEQHAAEDKDREQTVTARRPADQAEDRAGAEQQGPCLENVPNDDKAPAHCGALVTVFLLEPPWRPVVVGSIATARTVQRGDVLQRNENVPVQLYVGDVLHVAIGGEDAFLILAAEKGDLNLLALVFVRVVLHRGPQSSGASFPSRATYLATAQFGTPGISL